jgi:hypothetical protein
MLDNVIADMERGGIDYALVNMQVHGSKEIGIEVWRLPASSKPESK